jgi:hypothetical protein
VNKKKQPSQKLQIEQSQDILKILYFTLNYDIIIHNLTLYPESPEFRTSAAGKVAYSTSEKMGHNLVKNYRETHMSILQRDSQATFISKRIEDKIHYILNGGDRELEVLLEASPVEIKPN